MSRVLGFLGSGFRVSCFGVQGCFRTLKGSVVGAFV